MIFGNPQYLWLLVGWPVLALLGWRALAWRDSLAGRLGDRALVGRLSPSSTRRWRRRRLVLLLAAAALMIVAAARPQYGRIERTLDSSGVNVIVAVDVSPSMRARDVEPDRLERARASLRLLLGRLAGERVGIVAFAGEAVLQCPLTSDLTMARVALDSLDVDSVASAGTDIGAAISAAVRAFEHDGAEGGRVLVLLTDGEDHEGRAVEAAEQAAARGIAIFAIGIGSEIGVPLHEPQGGFKTDREQRTVTTALRMPTLARVARLTGGEALAAGDAPEAAIGAVAAAIDRQQRARFEERRVVTHQDRFSWFLFPALGLMLLALVMRPESTRRLGHKVAGGAVAPLGAK